MNEKGKMTDKTKDRRAKLTESLPDNGSWGFGTLFAIGFASFEKKGK